MRALFALLALIFAASAMSLAPRDIVRKNDGTGAGPGLRRRPDADETPDPLGVAYSGFCGRSHGHEPAVSRAKRALKRLLALFLAFAATSIAHAAPTPGEPGFFPIAVWWQAPASTHTTMGANLAEAAKAEGMNIFLGLSPWPTGFGTDGGAFAAVKVAGLYAIGGVYTPTTEDASAASVASQIALATAQASPETLIGYNLDDEPGARNPLIPGEVAILKGFDPSGRGVYANQTAWMTAPQFVHNLAVNIAALQATTVASADLYPLTDAWLATASIDSDFLTKGNDYLWMQGQMVLGLAHFARPGQPVWPFVESGSDNFGFSGANPVVTIGTMAGSSTITMVGHRSKFTRLWQGMGLAGAGLPPGVTVASIVDAAHAVLSAPATATASISATITGGANGGDCVVAANVCLANGNVYRPTDAQVNAEVWISIISGAQGIEEFCHDRTSYSFCLGDPAAGPAALATALNLTAANASIQAFAPVLAGATVGLCSEISQNYTTGAFTTSLSCANGELAMRSLPGLVGAPIPGAALLKSVGGVLYLFVQPSKRGEATYQFVGLPASRMTVVYDSNAQYDPGRSTVGRVIYSGAAGLADTLGAANDDYQVKIYKISR